MKHYVLGHFEVLKSFWLQGTLKLLLDFLNGQI